VNGIETFPAGLGRGTPDLSSVLSSHTERDAPLKKVRLRENGRVNGRGEEVGEKT